MFIRIFRVQVKPGKQDEFKKCLELLTLPTIQHRSGMVSFYPGQPAGPNADEFVLITVWRDAAADRMHSGADWAKAIIPAEVMPLVKEFSVQGYQAFGVSEAAPAPLFNLRASSI